jgi:hypothetical protein
MVGWWYTTFHIFLQYENNRECELGIVLHTIFGYWVFFWVLKPENFGFWVATPNTVPKPRNFWVKLYGWY